MTQTSLMNIQTEINLDKNDIVAIAVAEAEKKIRLNVTSCKQQVEQCKKDIQNAEKAFEKESNHLFTQKFKAKFKLIKDKIKSIQLGIEVKQNFRWGSSGNIITHTQKPNPIFNKFQITLVKELADDHHPAMTIYEKCFPPTKSQIKLVDDIKKFNLQKDEAIKQGNIWKRKQSDIPALERQMRAQVARQEISKNANGKAIIAAMMANLDETIKLIGM